MIKRLFSKKDAKKKQELEARLQAWYDHLNEAAQVALSQYAQAEIDRRIYRHMLFAHHYIGVDDQWHELPFENNRSDETPWLFDGQIFFKPTPRLSSGRGNA